jgi:hypothetical protein
MRLEICLAHSMIRSQNSIKTFETEQRTELQKTRHQQRVRYRNTHKERTTNHGAEVLCQIADAKEGSIWCYNSEVERTREPVDLQTIETLGSGSTSKLRNYPDPTLPLVRRTSLLLPQSAGRSSQGKLAANPRNLAKESPFEFGLYVNAMAQPMPQICI